MRLLVTGGAGMLGQAVAAAATRLGHDVFALSRAELDVTDADHVRRVVAAAEPRAVVNCAAWTDVDGAETAEAAATAVNASCRSRPTTSSMAPSASRGSSPTR
jgi:dTDP-4-dehydrorhamnose reductase